MAVRRVPKDIIPQWRLVAARLQGVPEAVGATIQRFAESQVTDFKDRIRLQAFVDFKRKKLSPWTVKAKHAHHLDPRTMIAWGNYVNGIKVIRSRTAGGLEFKIGFDPDVRAVNYDGSTSKLTLAQVAYIQEYGNITAGIPARRHWRPQFNRMQRMLPTLRRMITRSIVLSMAGHH